MGKVFYNLTMDELCDLMCGAPEEEQEDEQWEQEKAQQEKRVE